MSRWLTESPESPGQTHLSRQTLNEPDQSSTSWIPQSGKTSPGRSGKMRVFWRKYFDRKYKSVFHLCWFEDIADIWRVWEVKSVPLLSSPLLPPLPFPPLPQTDSPICHTSPSHSTPCWEKPLTVCIRATNFPEITLCSVSGFTTKL